MAEAGVDTNTYDDETFWGKPVPDLKNVTYVRGDAGALKSDVVTVLYFFQCFDKGAYFVNEELSQLTEKFKEGVQFVAISNDPEKEKVEKLLGKIADGTCCDPITKNVYRLSCPWVCWDEGKKVTKAMADICNTSILHAPQAFIVDSTGKLAWRQNLLQKHNFTQTNFGDQLAAVIAGKAVAKPHGNRPKVEVEGEAAECDDDMSLF